MVGWWDGLMGEVGSIQSRGFTLGYSYSTPLGLEEKIAHFHIFTLISFLCSHPSFRNFIFTGSKVIVVTTGNHFIIW